MPQYDAGTAALKVRPSFRDFATTVETELRRYDFHLDINIGADTRVAAAEIENLRRIARENATFRVDANTSTAAAEIEALRRAAARPIPVPVRPDIDRSASGRARRDLGKLVGDLKGAGTLNLKVLGVVGAAGAISEILAIGDAAAKAARSVALLPAIGFAGLAGAAGVGTGISGIGAAFKAAGAASKDAATDVISQRDALNSVADAEFRVRQSQASLSDAYRDSGRSIRDMNDSLVDQKFATQDAALSVQEAAKRLQQVQFDPTADSTTRARAKLSYDEAVQRLKEQQNKTEDLKTDTAEANAKGVEGSKQVTEARQAETQAVQALAKAQEAAAKGSTSQTKLDEAMAKLSPNAKQLVNDVRAIGPAWTDARKASQDALTEGMGSAVQHLADVQLPGLRGGLVGINTAINGGLRASIAALSSDTNKADFKTALDNTALGFANAAKGSSAWTNSLTKLTTVGTEFLPRFGDEIAGVATRFDNLIERTAADGSLKNWIQEGLTSGRELFEIIGHIGSSIASVFEAAGDDGSTLKKLDDLTERMSKFLKSTDGQGELKAFFASARESFDKMKPVLADLPDILKGVFAGFQAWSGIALPFLEAAGDLLAAHPGLVQDVVIAYLAFKTVGPVIDLVRIALANSSTALANFRGGISGATGAAGSAVGGLGTLLGAAGPLGVAALTIGAGAGLLYLTNRHNDAARAADEQRQKERALRDTLDEGTGKVTQKTIDTAGRELQDAGFFTRAKSFGIAPKALVNASLGLADADKAAINAQLTGTIVQSLGRDDRFSGQTGTKKRFTTAGLTDQDISQALAGVPEAVKKYADAIAQYNKALPANQSKLALPDLAALKGELDDVGESAATLAGKMNGYNTVTGELGTQTTELNAATTDQVKLTDQAKQRFDALGIAVQQVPRAAEVIIKDTSVENIARLKELGYTVEKLPDGDLKLTANTDQAKADIQAVATAPYHANLNFTVTWPGGIQGALAQSTLERLHENVDNIPTAPGHAGGGFLPTTGPGTSTRDGILGVMRSGMPLARLDGGEAITRRAMANRYRGELRDINAGTFPKLPGYADGGIVVDENGNIIDPTADSSTIAGQAQLYPQAALPGRATDAQLQTLSGRAAVDSANSERNQIYANPASTAQDKLASDIKYQQAQNALESATKTGTGSAPVSLQGVLSKAGGILATGILSGLGLEKSILSETGYYSGSIRTAADFYGTNTGIGGGYSYTPQNLPGITTNSTPQSSDPSLSTQIPGSGPITGGTAVNPDLGTVNVTVPGKGSNYTVGAGAEQWRGLALQALQREGFSTGQVNIMLAQIQSESGGNPSIVQGVHDVNSGGNEAVGLLQVIPGTFATYRDPSLPNDRTNPSANMIAALRYYKATYGTDLSTMWGQGHGYDDGGIAQGIGAMFKNTLRPERVLSPRQTETFDSVIPLLESINASTWSPNRINNDHFTGPNQAPVRSGPDLSTTVHARVANVNDLADLVERQNQMKAIGLSAAL